MAETPPLILAPTDPAQWPEWRKALDEIRQSSLTPEITRSFDRPEFQWIGSCVVCGMVMLFDREFYDAEKNEFKVEAYVARQRREFGGLDALVLWQAYPRIGFDSRNQYDHYRLAPGLKAAVDLLHKLGVKVFMAYNPWDTGTRREPTPDSESIANIIREFDFDGVFLDTLREGDKVLRAALDKAKPGVVMESEDALPVAALAENHASWAQWFDDSEAPGIMRNRWIERSHMMHVIRRWDLDHTGELQMAWMNGAGVLVWENIFGSWNGWAERDKTILRAIVPIRRVFARMFEKGDWEPLVPTHLDGVYATRWTLNQVTLYTLVNRREEAASGQLFPLSSDGSTRLFDLVRGHEIDHAMMEIPARGVGALLVYLSSQVDDSLRAAIRSFGSHPTAATGARVEPLTVRVETPWSKDRSTYPEMVVIPGGEHAVVTRMWVRECGEYGPARFAGQSYLPLHYEREIVQTVHVRKCAVARKEVTNREFLLFVESGYKPTHSASYLAHWQNDRPVGSDLDLPVRFVSLEDARSYARWRGLRLPTEIEWQIAVTSHALGHGEIWNWTESEHFDGHTRFSILKGGCTWQAKGSEWYADSGPQKPDWSSKFIHFYPSLDRCETIGFRCAVDL